MRIESTQNELSVAAPLSKESNDIITYIKDNLKSDNTHYQSVNNQGTFNINNPNIYYQDNIELTDSDKQESENYKNFVKKVFNNKLTNKEKSRPYIIGNTPTILQKAGISNNKLSIGVKAIIKAQAKKNKDHELSDTTIGKVVEELHNPIVIIKDKQKPNEKVPKNRFSIIVDLQANNGNYVLVGIESERNTGNAILNDIRSIHSRESFAQQIDEALTEGRLIKVKESKIKDLLNHNQSEPISEGATSLIERIRQKDNEVKIFYQSAYHGTPHKFDKFSTEHVGTGEGNQAHGWGLYFASDKNISEEYRKELSTDVWKYKGKELKQEQIQEKVNEKYNEIVEAGESDEKAFMLTKMLSSFANNIFKEDTEKALNWLDKLRFTNKTETQLFGGVEMNVNADEIQHQSAMYKAPQNNIEDFIDEVYRKESEAKNTSNKINKSYFNYTDNNINVRIPHDTIIHDNKHNLTPTDWKDVLNNLNNPQSAILSNKPRFDGQPVLLKIQGNKTYGVVLECFDNKQPLITTAFADTEENIDNWIKKEGLSQAQNTSAVTTKGMLLSRYPYDIITYIKDNLKSNNTHYQSVNNHGPFNINNSNIYYQDNLYIDDDINQRTDKTKYLTNNEVKQLEKDKENFETYTDKLINNQLSPLTQLRVLEKLPSAYNNIPELKGKKVVINQEVYKKIIDLPNKFNKNHFIDRTRAKKLPQLISDPLYILKSVSIGNEHRFVIVTNSKNNQTHKSNKQTEKLSIILEPSSNVAVVSAYDETINISEEKKAKRVLYDKKKELSKTLAASKTVTIDSSNNSITHKDDKFKSSFENSFGDTAENIQEHLKQDILNILEDNSINKDEFDIKAIKLYGSQINCNAKYSSNLDVLVQYSGSMKEDTAFNLLNSENLTIQNANGKNIKVDINPINEEISGTIDEHLEYLSNLEGKSQNSNTFYQSAMYASEAKNVSEFYDIEISKNGNDTKAQFNYKTKEGCQLRIPHDTIIHVENKHKLTKKQWENLLKNIDIIKGFTPSKQKPRYGGNPVLLKIKTKNNTFGCVIELFEKSNPIIATAFIDNESNIDNWIKTEASSSGTKTSFSTIHLNDIITDNRPNFKSNNTYYQSAMISGINPNQKIDVVDLTSQFPADSNLTKTDLKNHFKSLIGVSINSKDKKAILNFVKSSKRTGKKDVFMPAHIVDSSKYERNYKGERNTALNNIVDLIQNSFLIDIEPNNKKLEKPNVDNYLRFYVPVQINNDIYTVRISAENNAKNNLFNILSADVYDVIIDKKMSSKVHRPANAAQLTKMTSNKMMASSPSTKGNFVKPSSNNSINGNGNNFNPNQITIEDMLRGVKDPKGNTYYQEVTPSPLDYDYINHQKTDEKIAIEMNEDIKVDKIEPTKISSELPFVLSQKPGDNKKSLVKSVGVDQGKKIKVVNKNTNEEVIINKRSVEKSHSNISIKDKNYKDFCSIIYNIAELFETSQKILSHSDTKNNYEKLHRYSNVVQINNNKYLLEFVTRVKGEIKLYSIDLLNNKAVSENAYTDKNPSATDTANNSIAYIQDIIKTKLIKKYNKDYNKAIKAHSNKNQSLFQENFKPDNADDIPFNGVLGDIRQKIRTERKLKEGEYLGFFTQRNNTARNYIKY